MKIKLANFDLKNPLVEQVERMSGEDARMCYQCGNCTGGCPVTFDMEIPPSQIMRMLQIGRIDDVMKANSMWVCVGCLQCYSRCPKGVSVAAVLEACRQMSLRKGEGKTEIKELNPVFVKDAPQQALVCAFRKLVG